MAVLPTLSDSCLSIFTRNGSVLTGLAPGTCSVSATFSNLSTSISIQVFSSPITVVALSPLTFPNQSETAIPVNLSNTVFTLTGPRLTTTIPVFTLTLSDGTLLLSSSLTINLSALVVFNSSSPTVVTYVNGVTTLLQNSPVIITISVASLTNATIACSVLVWANLLPSGFVDVDMGATVGTSLPAIAGSVGTLFDVPLHFWNGGVTAVEGLRIDVTYDANKVAFVVGKMATSTPRFTYITFAANAYVASNVSQPSYIRIVGVGAGNTGLVDLAVITFKIIDATPALVAFGGQVVTLVATNSSGVAVIASNVSFVSGQVTMWINKPVGANRRTPTNLLYHGDDHVRGDVIGKGDVRMRRALCGGLYPTGDVNTDCVFDVSDQVLTLGYLTNNNNATLLGLTRPQVARMDVNVDGLVTMTDLNLMTLVSVGLRRFVVTPHVIQVQDSNSLCQLQLSVRLEQDSGESSFGNDPSLANSTLVYFVLTGNSSSFQTQVLSTFPSMPDTFSSLMTPYGGVVKATYQPATGTWNLITTTDISQPDWLGVSVFQVTLDATGAPLTYTTNGTTLTDFRRIGLATGNTTSNTSAFFNPITINISNPAVTYSTRSNFFAAIAFSNTVNSSSCVINRTPQALMDVARASSPLTLSSVATFTWQAPAIPPYTVTQYRLYYSASTTQPAQYYPGPAAASPDIQAVKTRFLNRNQTTVADERTISVPNLLPYTQYNYRLVALTAQEGEGFFTSTGTLTTDPTAPTSSPRNFTATAVSPTAVVLTWSAPPLPLNGNHTHYNVSFVRIAATSDDRVDSTQLAANSLLITADTLTYTFTSLERYIQYTVSVAAVTANLQGLPTYIGPVANVTLFTLMAAPGLPPTVTNVTAINSTALQVSWLAPPKIYQYGLITSYIVTYQMSNATPRDTNTVVYRADFIAANLSAVAAMSSITLSVPIIAAGEIISIVITGLSANLDYDVTVVAVNMAVSLGPLPSMSSSSVKQRTLVVPADGPPLNVVLYTINSTALNLSWALPAITLENGVTAGFVVSLLRVLPQKNTAQLGDRCNQIYCSMFVSRTDTTVLKFYLAIVNLEPDTFYAVNIAAYNVNGSNGVVSGSLVETTAEAAPTGVVQSLTFVTTNTSASFTWTQPLIYLRNGNITSYTLIWSRLFSPYVNPLTDNTTVTRVTITILNQNSTSFCLITGLEAFTNYTIELAANTLAGSGVVLSFTVTTLEYRPSAPPQTLVATLLPILPPQYNQSIVLNWTAPLFSEQHGVIRGYYILFSPASNDLRKLDPAFHELTYPTTNFDFSTPTYSLTIFGLQPFVTFVFFITAYTNYSIKLGPGTFAAAFPVLLPVVKNVTAQTLSYIPTLAPTFTVVALNGTALRITVTTLNITQQNGNILGYTILYQRSAAGNDFADPGITNCTINNCTLALTSDKLVQDFANLEEYVTYDFFVYASTSVGDGPVAAVYATRTLSATPVATPVNLTLVPRSKYSAQWQLGVSWGAPAKYLQNGPIVTYQVVVVQAAAVWFNGTSQTFATDPQRVVYTIVLNSSTLTTTATPLSAYRNYTFYVSFITYLGTYGPNASITLATTPAPAKPPPAIDIVTTPSLTTVSLQWLKAFDTFTGPITKVQILVELSGSVKIVNQNITTNVSYIKTETNSSGALVNNTYYNVSSSVIGSPVSRFITASESCLPAINFVNTDPAEPNLTKSVCGGWCTRACPLGVTMDLLKLTNQSFPTTDTRVGLGTRNTLNGATLPYIAYERVFAYNSTSNTSNVSFAVNNTAGVALIGDTSTYTLLDGNFSFQSPPLVPGSSYQFRLIIYTTDYLFTIGPAGAQVDLAPIPTTTTPEAPAASAGGGGGLGLAAAGGGGAIAILVAFLVYRKRRGLAPFTKKPGSDPLPPTPTSSGNFLQVKMNNTLISLNSLHSGYVGGVEMNEENIMFAPIVLPVTGVWTSRPAGAPHGSDIGLTIPPVPVLPPVHNRVLTLKELPTMFLEMSFNSNFAFSEEYECLETGAQFSRMASMILANKLKNRFANILAYDYNRVRLPILNKDDPSSDFINANYIDGYKKPNYYIAAQGPTAGTVNDFWYMLWENKTDVIVMLTNLEEKGKVKCHQYWPVAVQGQLAILSDFVVTLLQEEMFPDYLIRTMKAVRGRETRIVNQFHYITWPDHGVPQSSATSLIICRKTKEFRKPSSGPVVIHCSAGVGRTGTLMAIDFNLDMAAAEKKVDIFGTLNKFRRQRNTMVQTEDQYVFIYQTLRDSLAESVNQLTAAELPGFCASLRTVGSDGTMLLESMFKMLQDSTATVQLTFRTDTAQLAANKTKNRFQNVLPYENTRVKLITLPGVVGSDYINASFVDDYKRKGAFLATQGPMENTVADFWRMVWEQDADSIVMLTQVMENDRVKSECYWPVAVKGLQQWGNLQVELVDETVSPEFIVRTLKVVDLLTEVTREVKHFQSIEWPGTGAPKSGVPSIRLLDALANYQNDRVAVFSENIYGNSTMVEEQARLKQLKLTVVHCSAGVGRTGVFCALSILLNSLRGTGKVDVITCIKHIRTQRMSLVQTMDQLEFLFTTLVESLSLSKDLGEQMYGNIEILRPRGPSVSQPRATMMVPPNTARRNAPAPSLPLDFPLVLGFSDSVLDSSSSLDTLQRSDNVSIPAATTLQRSGSVSMPPRAGSVPILPTPHPGNVSVLNPLSSTKEQIGYGFEL